MLCLCKGTKKKQVINIEYSVPTHEFFHAFYMLQEKRFYFINILLSYIGFLLLKVSFVSMAIVSVLTIVESNLHPFLTFKMCVFSYILLTYLLTNVSTLRFHLGITPLQHMFLALLR
jgi:hypothetical protein